MEGSSRSTHHTEERLADDAAVVELSPEPFVALQEHVRERERLAAGERASLDMSVQARVDLSLRATTHRVCQQTGSLFIKIGLSGGCGIIA